MTRRIGIIVVTIIGSGAAPGDAAPKRRGPGALERINAVLEVTRPLKGSRGVRMPLYVWAANSLEGADDAEAERLLKQLDARGIAFITNWDANVKRRDTVLAETIRVGKIQKRLGLPITVNATRCMRPFFDGSPDTAHVDDNGERFFDASFNPKIKMGCPFALEGQWARVRGQIEFFCEGCRRAGLRADVVFGDWEIDGPIEWNGAWDCSKRCVRCRKNIPGIEDFGAFQRALRRIRNTLQREVFVKTFQAAFPGARIGNYAEYPCDGLRYWYDWFEVLPEGAPFIAEQRAQYRHWYKGFHETGYTAGMPVIYPWRYISNEYDFDDRDYRWVYNMLLVASNAGRSRDEKSPDLPLAPFVHWRPTGKSMRAAEEDPHPMSERAYRELLWHVLLRGADTLIMWCESDLDRIRAETKPVHEVWAAALEYCEFFEKGVSVTFDLPKQPGDVISGRALGKRVLIRRSRFGAAKTESISIRHNGRAVHVPVFTDDCRILPLE